MAIAAAPHGARLDHDSTSIDGGEGVRDEIDDDEVDCG